MLTGPNGGVSSKRACMFAVLGIWLLGFAVNLFTGKVVADTYLEQNLILILTFSGIVFGDNIVKSNKDVRLKEADIAHDEKEETK